MLKLYHLESCPFCQRVRKVLAEMDLPFESRLVDPWDRSEVERLSGQTLVPVLVDGEQVMSDSSAILDYLREKYGRRAETID